MRINPEALARARGRGVSDEDIANPFTLPSVPPRVKPAGAGMAMDEDLTGLYQWASQDAYVEGQVFLGYPTLAAMTQRAEYRRPAEIIAEEMTRKWIKIKATGDEDKSDKVKELEEEFERIGARRIFREAIEQDGFFGRSQIYFDLGDLTDDELKLPLVVSNLKIRKGALKRLAVIDPIWTYPGQYDSTNPLSKDFYKPTSWFVLSREIHSSRLITIVSREVPDILKPAYLFGGLSLLQMGKPYVDNWLRTRQSVSDLLHSFTVMVLKSNMASILEGGAGDDFFGRLDIFNQCRDNRGVFAIDKDTEDFSNVSAPLGGLDHLQAQAQEHQAGVFGIPLVKLFGISPSGLNASSEGEISTFYDGIAARQERLEPSVRKVMQIAQLSLWGEIDPDITFDFEPLEEMDATEQAALRKTEAETGKVLIDAGVIDPGEERKRVAEEEDSPYAGLDLNKEITPPGQEGMGMPGMPGMGGEGGEDIPGAEGGAGGDLEIPAGAPPAAPPGPPQQVQQTQPPRI